MTSSRIPGRLYEKLYTKYQLGDLEFLMEVMGLLIEMNIEMIIIQVVEMDAAVIDDTKIMWTILWKFHWINVNIFTNLIYLRFLLV